MLAWAFKGTARGLTDMLPLQYHGNAFGSCLWCLTSSKMQAAKKAIIE